MDLFLRIALVIAACSFVIYLVLVVISSNRKRFSMDILSWKDDVEIGDLESEINENELRITLKNGAEHVIPKNQILDVGDYKFLIPLWLKDALENLVRLQEVGSRLDDIERMYLGKQITREKFIEMISEMINLGLLNKAVSALSSLNAEILELKRVKYDVSKEMAAIHVAFKARTVKRNRYRTLISELSMKYELINKKLELLEGWAVTINGYYESLRKRLYMKEMEESECGITSVRLSL